MKLGRLEPWWHRGRGWWSERSLREQILLGTLAALALAAFVMLVVLKPLQSAKTQALARLRTAQMLEARASAGGAAVLANAQVRSGAPSTIVTETVAAAGLTMQRIEPEGAALRVALGDAPFENVMRWAADLESSSRLRVQQAKIARASSPGMVSAQFLVGGS